MTGPETLHANCVALDGRGILITGASGSGKSALSLQLMALGAVLVADDRTLLQRDGEALIASCPPPLKGLIEARGVGILNADSVDRIAIHLSVDLDAAETQRLPPRREGILCGCSIPLLHKVEGIHFAPAIVQMLRAGRNA